MGESPTLTRSRGWLWTALLCLVLLSGCVRPKCPRCGAMGGAANSKGPGGGGPGGGGRPGFPAHDNGGPGDFRDRAPAEDFVPPGFPPGVPPGEFPPGEFPPFEDVPPFNDATATVTPTPTISPTPTVTATPTVTPTTIPTFHACTPDQIDAAVQWVASTPTPAPGTAPSSPCAASSQLRLYCALVPKEEPGKQLLARKDGNAEKLRNLFLTSSSPPACTELGKACLEGADAKDPNGRTFLGYALRYGHDVLANAMLSSSCAMDSGLSSASPQDSPLTAVLNRLLEEARQCTRPPAGNGNPSEQTIALRLEQLAKLLDGPPPLPTIDPNAYYKDITLPDHNAQGQAARTVPAAPPALVSVVRFASGGNPQTPQRTGSLEPISLLREIFYRCPAVQEKALDLASALYRRGSGYPMFTDFAEEKRESFECRFLTRVGRPCWQPPDPAPPMPR